ncbi:hypothetical protein TH5N_21370 [Tetragenococcus halophilus]|nr:hypothetical protein TEHN7121_1049 [Tetragenococcus halophilus subsp. halophilus]GEQ39014.1 hypothetical protein TH3N_21400 [Tetragenococcus halophilus]GEQ41259.1 hypothetical protein TH5N_21370 [Tetragenococcus halophilus]GEQ43510.1 hypothetical protein TH6N_21360 [Tetragenococcus halophilus]GEQ45779.1 hypothetical protein TH8N_21490 [Tetragenococcus halophilus]
MLRIGRVSNFLLFCDAYIKEAYIQLTQDVYCGKITTSNVQLQYIFVYLENFKNLLDRVVCIRIMINAITNSLGTSTLFYFYRELMAGENQQNR